MHTRTTLAAAALALHAALLPAPAPAQANVPPAIERSDQADHLFSRPVMTVVGLLFAGALMGDYEFREETQERRDGLTNALAEVGNTFGDWRYLVPALSAGYLAG